MAALLSPSPTAGGGDPRLGGWRSLLGPIVGCAASDVDGGVEVEAAGIAADLLRQRLEAGLAAFAWPPCASRRASTARGLRIATMRQVEG